MFDKFGQILAVMTAALTVAAAPELKDFAPFDRNEQGKVVFLYDFEPDSQNPKVPAPYKIIKGEGVTGGGGLVLSRPDSKGKYVFFKKDFKNLEPGKSYRLSVMTRIRDLRGGNGKPVSGRMFLAGFDFHGGG